MKESRADHTRDTKQRRTEAGMEKKNRQAVLRIGSGGAIRGVLGTDLDRQDLVTLGNVLSAEGTVGLGSSGSTAAKMLARAAAAGVACGGGGTLAHPLDCPVQGAWVARREQLPVSLFVEEVGKTIFLHLFDQQGLPLERDRARNLEQTLVGYELRRVPGHLVGAIRRLEAEEESWAEDVVRQAALHRPALRRVTAAVEGDAPESRALRAALAALGCRVEEHWRPGIPGFWADHGGFFLGARDEKGVLLDSGQLLTLVALIEMENGSGTIAVLPQASAAVDLVAMGYGGTVLRLDRDGERARKRYAAQPWVREAPSAAVRICARMGVAGQKLETLISKTPRFNAWKREVPLESDRDRVLEALAREQGCPPRGEGLRLHTGGGWVYLAPRKDRPALRVMAEGPDLELAAELCDLYAGRAAALDRAIAGRTERGKDP